MVKHPGHPGIEAIIKEFLAGIEKQTSNGKFFFSQEYECLTENEISKFKTNFESLGFKTEVEVVFQDKVVTTHMLTVMW
jgi:hypothetical protein